MFARWMSWSLGTALAVNLLVACGGDERRQRRGGNGGRADKVAPAAIGDLSVTGFTQSSITLAWTAVADNVGTTAYELRYISSIACRINETNLATATIVSGVPPPKAPATPESFEVTGLTPATTYCFALKVADAAGNLSALSNVVSGSTSDPTDDTPPAAADLTLGAVTTTTVQINWTAVGDDDTTGTASSYDLRYLPAGSCPLSVAKFSSATQVSPMPAPAVAGTAETKVVTGLDVDTSYCFALEVMDDNSNTSLSNSLDAATTTDPGDVTAPAAAILAADPITATSAQITWTAVGDDANAGTASSYELRFLPSASCPITMANFGSGTLVPGLPSPQTAGKPESIVITGLKPYTMSCFALLVTDDNSNVSLSNSLEITTPACTGDAAAQIGEIRTALKDAATPTVDLALEVCDAVVSYIKTDAGSGASEGEVDGPGFFIQAGNTGPAIFVAVDPATVDSGLVVGDSLDLSVSAAAWAACYTPCESVNGRMHMVRAAVGWKTGTATVPTAQNVNNVAFSNNIAEEPWEYESELVSYTATIASGQSSAGTGFSRAQVTTAGTPAAGENFEIRLPSAVFDALHLVLGCQISVAGSPMWRFANNTQLAAWDESELSVTCPPPQVVSAVAADATTVHVVFDQEIKAASITDAVSQFTITGGTGLTVSSATLSGDLKSAILTTTAHAGNESYILTVASSVTNLHDVGIDSGANTAAFLGFSIPAVALLNEVKCAGPMPDDFIEIYVLAGGSMGGWVVKEWANGSSPEAEYTFDPTFHPDTGDYVVLHYDPANQGTFAQEDDVGSTKDESAASDHVDTAWDVYANQNPPSGVRTHCTSTDSFIVLERAGVVVDSVAISNQDAAITGTGLSGTMEGIFGTVFGTVSLKWTGFSQAPDTTNDSLVQSECADNGVWATASAQRDADYTPEGGGIRDTDTDAEWCLAPTTMGTPNADCPICGNGKVEQGETCDDGNEDACGTCTADCGTTQVGGDCAATIGCASQADCSGACRWDSDERDCDS